jgi:hypothetical protein
MRRAESDGTAQIFVLLGHLYYMNGGGKASTNGKLIKGDYARRWCAMGMGLTPVICVHSHILSRVLLAKLCVAKAVRYGEGECAGDAT